MKQQDRWPKLAILMAREQEPSLATYVGKAVGARQPARRRPQEADGAQVVLSVKKNRKQRQWANRLEKKRTLASFVTAPWPESGSSRPLRARAALGRVPLEAGAP